MADTNTQELGRPINALDAGQDILIAVWQKANESGWITLTGLDPDTLASGKLLPEDEDKIVLFVSGMGDSAAWARGDFSLYVRDKVRERTRVEGWTQQQYNETWANELDRLSRRFGVSPKTLQNNIATCSTWAHDVRVAGQHVRYKHHEALPASMDMDTRIAYLRQCEEEGWTWARLYKIARGDLLPDGSEGTPARGNPLLNGTPVDEQIADVAERPQENDELDTIDTDGLLDVDVAEVTPFDADDVSEPVETVEGEVMPTWGARTAVAHQDGTDDLWASVSWHDGHTTTLLAEAQPVNQSFNILFADGSTWRVTADVSMQVVRVEHL